MQTHDETPAYQMELQFAAVNTAAETESSMTPKESEVAGQDSEPVLNNAKAPAQQIPVLQQETYSRAARSLPSTRPRFNAITAAIKVTPVPEDLLRPPFSASLPWRARPRTRRRRQVSAPLIICSAPAPKTGTFLGTLPLSRPDCMGTLGTSGRSSIRSGNGLPALYLSRSGHFGPFQANFDQDGETLERDEFDSWLKTVVPCRATLILAGLAACAPHQETLLGTHFGTVPSSDSILLWKEAADV